jgi:hypothetical protein
MFESLPTRPGDAEAVDRYLNDLRDASYKRLEDLRDQLIGRAMTGDHVAAHLLDLLTAEMDTRYEGRLAAHRRAQAQIEGLEQVRDRRRGNQWHLTETTTAKGDNQPMWDRPLDLPTDQAWLAFRGTAARDTYAANAGARRLILQKD